MRADHSMMTNEELRERRQRRRRLLLSIVALLALIIVVFLAARPTRSAIRGWQARRHAAAAFALIEQANWNDARQEAVAAYQLRPSEPQALRAIARFLSRTRQQQAFEFWDRLAQIESLTPADLRDEITAALSTGELPRASAPLGQLLADDGRHATARDWLLAAQWQLQQGAPGKALDSLDRLFAMPEVAPREQFQGLVLQLQAARTGNARLDNAKLSAAWQGLSQFARGRDALALDSLVLLAQRNLTTPKAQAGEQKPEVDQASDSDPSPSSALGPEELFRRLLAHPLAQAPQKLLAIDLQITAKPNEREALITRAIADWKNAETAQLVVLATWLNGKGEYQRQLDEVPPEKALASRELFLQRMDSLGALGRWDEIRSLLESERFPLDPVMQRMYLARTDTQLGNKAAARNNWQRALEAANGDVIKSMGLGEYAEKNGALEIAEAAYSAAIAGAPRARAAWQGKLRAASLQRDTAKLHTVLAAMLPLWPNDTAIRNDEAYTHLLLMPQRQKGPSSEAKTGEGAARDEAPHDGNQKSGTGLSQAASGVASDNVPEIERLARELITREPASLPHRTLFALALLKESRDADALEVYSGIQIPANALTPGAIALHAAILSANGRMEDARKEIINLPNESLLPEEQSLIANLRE